MRVLTTLLLYKIAITIPQCTFIRVLTILYSSSTLDSGTYTSSIRTMLHFCKTYGRTQDQFNPGCHSFEMDI